MNNKLNRIQDVIFILAAAGILILSLFSWFSGDDICYQTELARYSVLEKAWLQYIHWDGRSLSIPSLIQLFGLKYWPAPAMTFLSSMAFLGIAYLIYKLTHETNNTKGNVYAAVGMLSTVLWLGLWKLVPDILYWPTGSWYSWMCLLGLIWLWKFTHDLKNRKWQLRDCFLIFLVSFLCGNNSHNFTVALIVLAAIRVLYERRVRKENANTRYILFSLAGLVIGAVVVLAAPGNTERLEAVRWGGWSPEFFYHYLLVLARYLYWLVSLFALLALLCIFHGDKNFNREKGSGDQPKTGYLKALLTACYNHRYLIAAFATIAVFSATSFFAVPRTALFFSVFIVLYIIERFRIDLLKTPSPVVTKGKIIFGISFLFIAGYNALGAARIRKELKLREQIFISEKGRDVVINQIPYDAVPFAYTFIDLEPDTGHWINRCFANRYGLKTVRTTEIR